MHSWGKRCLRNATDYIVESSAESADDATKMLLRQSCAPVPRHVPTVPDQATWGLQPAATSATDDGLLPPPTACDVRAPPASEVCWHRWPDHSRWRQSRHRCPVPPPCEPRWRWPPFASGRRGAAQAETEHRRATATASLRRLARREPPACRRHYSLPWLPTAAAAPPSPPPTQTPRAHRGSRAKDESRCRRRRRVRPPLLSPRSRPGRPRRRCCWRPRPASCPAPCCWQRRRNRPWPQLSPRCCPGRTRPALCR
mmetsp:Transcript_49438/g.132736  ORF Transcript_49438/g.132736 Transcript_49438/m.132736 type:complete len:255 (-) Transcript_49438:274-1038(-)